jgi:hypothetical protein
MNTQENHIFAQRLKQAILNWKLALTAVLPENYTTAQLEDALEDVLKQGLQSASDKLLTMLVQGVDHFQKQPLTQVNFALTFELMTVIQEAHHALLIIEKLEITTIPDWHFHEIAPHDKDQYIALKIMDLAGKYSEATQCKRNMWQGLNVQT